MSMPARTALLILLSLGFVRLTAADSDELTALRFKAEHGNALAQYNLALVYAQGRQVPADPAEAFAWFSLASESGATGKALDSLLGKITDVQLAEGRRRLGTYRTAVYAKSSAAATHTSPKLAPRGFTVEIPPVTPPAPDPAVPVAKAPEAVLPPITSTPAEGTGLTELALARKDLAQAHIDLQAANTELTTLRASVTRLESAAAETKASETRLTEELASTRHELATLKPVPALSPTEKSKAEDPAPHRP